jgi:class 3 adenylate cyclase
MKEATDSFEFASILGDFVENARRAVWEDNGLFDKFTGDGFLAYWAPTPAAKARVLRSIFGVARRLHRDFRDRYIPLLRANSQNFPENKVGLGIGLDDGSAYPVAIADDPTIVGPAVVGAVRMVAQARGGETLANSHLGSQLELLTRDGSLPGVSVVPQVVPSKEYEWQTAYAIKFLDEEERTEVS